MNKFPERLKQLRDVRGVSQAAVSKEIGVSRYAIYSYEKGKTAPTLDGLIMLADYFDVTTDYLLGRSDTPKGP